MRRVRSLAAAAGIGALGWGWFEAGWVRLRRLEVEIEGLTPALAGLRIAHLSDFHLGFPSRAGRAAELAVSWTEARSPDLVCITGDLLTHPRGYARLRALLARLPGAIVVLGNHDFGVARDPFAKRAAPFDVGPARLLRDDALTFELRGCRVQVVGVDPRSYMARRLRPESLADHAADFRLLLCHFPLVLDWISPAVFHLLLAGHLHDGQISIPYLGGKLRLAHPRYPYPCGLYRRDGSTMHVSPGLGTTFVPFRFFARPEATELVLRRR